MNMKTNEHLIFIFGEDDTIVRAPVAPWRINEYF